MTGKPKKTVQKKTVLTSKVSEISTTNLSAFKTIVIKDEMRPAMQGVFFDKENNAIVATDARKMLIVYADVCLSRGIGRKRRATQPGALTLGQAPNYRDWETDRKSTRLNSSHSGESRMPSSA